MGKTRKIVLGSFIAAFLILACGAAWLYVVLDRWFQPNPPESTLPPLVRNLPRQALDIEPEFQRRVRAQFPGGIATTALWDDLRQEGFRISEDHASGLIIAVLEQHSPICAKTWIVSWRPDLQGRARNIDGHFNLGCL